MVCPPAVALYCTVPPHVFPDGNGVAEVFCVCMVPPFVTVESVPNNWLVAIFKVPPKVVVKVPFTVKAPPAT